LKPAQAGIVQHKHKNFYKINFFSKHPNKAINIFNKLICNAIKGNLNQFKYLNRGKERERNRVRERERNRARERERERERERNRARVGEIGRENERKREIEK
jgi:hypothetical protein